MEDPLLGADLLQPLDIFEHSIDNLVNVGETLLGQCDLHVEVREDVKFVITSSRELHGVVLLLQVAEERVLTLVADQVREVAEWARPELLAHVWQHPVKLEGLLVFDRLVTGDFAKVAAVEGHLGKGEVGHSNVLIFDTIKK